MPLRGVTASLVLVAVLLGIHSVIPGVAVAKQQVYAADTNISVDLGAGHGVVQISKGVASVFSVRGDRFTTYSAAARMRSSGLLVRFGRLGHIALRFESEGRPSTDPPSSVCRGGSQTRSDGTFSGSVDLNSRFGFRPFHDKSFSGSGWLIRTPRLVCDLPKERGPFEKSGDGVLISAQNCDGRAFSAQGRRPSAGGSDLVSYSGSATQQVGRTKVFQSVGAMASARSLDLDETLASVTVEPPPPFEGTATFSREEDGSNGWSGSLSVPIFGKDVSLAGPEFKSDLRSFPLKPGVGLLFATSFQCPGAGYSAFRRIDLAMP